MHLPNTPDRLRDIARHILEVPVPDPEDARRRRLLNIMLVAFTVVTLAILASALIAAPLGVAGNPTEVRLLVAGSLLGIVGLAVLYVMNRYVSGMLTSALFLVFVTVLVSISDEPWQVVSGRSVFLFAIPILAASVLLWPWASFVAAAASSAAVVIVGLWVPGHLPAAPVLLGFFLLALVAYLSAHHLEQALREVRIANQRLEESDVMLRLIFENAFDGVSVYEELPDTGSRRLVDCNERYVQMSGRSKKELLAAGNTAVFHKKLEPDRARDENLRIRREHESYRGLFSWVRPDGRENIVEYSAMPAEIGNRPLTVGIDRDITERVRAERAQRAYSEHLEDQVRERTRDLEAAQVRLLRQERLAVLGQLAGSIGHELRNPLGAIKNAAYLVRLLSNAQQVDQAREALDIVEQEVGSADRIIRTLLDFARTRAPDRQRIDLNEIVQSAISHARIPAGIQVDRRLEVALPSLWADPDQLEQVLGNLLQNAVQAMPAGGRLSVATGHGDGDTIEVLVTDTGTGMSDEVLAHLFEPLFTTKLRGIGLGLALCKMLVEGHGGTIGAQSEQGVGSTFVVRLRPDGEPVYS